MNGIIITKKLQRIIEFGRSLDGVFLVFIRLIIFPANIIQRANLQNIVAIVQYS